MTAPARPVLAIVLTHSDPDALVTCVRAVLAQRRAPDRVLVVDNAGAPAATETLAAAGLLDARVEIVTADHNAGPAGGHALGLQRFLDSDAASAWILDDDCVPEPECLGRLLDEAHCGPVHLSPEWVQPDGTVTAHPAWNGVLLGRDVVETAGLPRAELFWWGEDTEYLLWRLPSLGFDRRVVPTARVLHTRARRSDRRPAWKYFYEARNTVYLRVREHHRPGKVPRILGRLAGGIVVREDQRARKLAALARGAVDGVRGRLGITFPVRGSDGAVPGPVVHLLPTETAGGAQVYARLLADRLADEKQTHLVVTVFPDGGGALRRVGFDPFAAWRLREALRRLGPSVVVAHGGEPLQYAVGATRAPLIYYRVGLLAPKATRPPRRWLYQALAARCAAVAGVSAEVVDEARAVLRVQDDRLWVVPNGRPVEDFTGPSGQPATPVLLWVGRLVAHKRPEWFVEAVAELRRRWPDLDAWMAGDGPLLDGLRPRAERAGVALLGRRTDIPALLSKASVVCFTGRGDGEGLPGVLIEAGLAARPVVTTDVAGAGTIVADGESGLVVPTDDRAAFIAAVDRLLEDPDLGARLGACARARCADRFSLDTSAAEWRTLLDGLSP